MPAEPTISIIIPLFNGGEKFKKCLASIQKLAVPPEETIVVADGESDGSWRLAGDLGIKVIRLPMTTGPASARNRGANAAKGDIVMFIDADVIVPRNLVGQVSEVFRLNPEISALFGSYDDSPSEPDFLSQYKNLFHHFVHQKSNIEASTFWAGCGAIKRDIFRELGGFDESYRAPSIEDIEFGYRIKAAGHSILLLKNLRVKHLKRWKAYSFLKTEFFHRALPWVKLILNTRHLPLDLNLGSSYIVSVIFIHLFLIFCFGIFLFPWSLVPAILIIIAIVLINLRLYLFFKNKHGMWFMGKAVLMHWFYLFYCGLAIIVGLILHLWEQKSAKSPG